MPPLTMIDPEKPLIVAQSNRLVESRYTLTVGEQRLVLAMISLIHPEDEDFKPYVIKIRDLARFLNMDLKNAYREVDKITDRIMERVLQIHLGGNDWLKTHWVSSAKYKKGAVTLSFDPNLKPYLLKLKEQFTRYRLTVIAQFKSIYTIRIYGLLKQYEKLGVRAIDLIELREMLGIGHDEYQEFKRFKFRVLNQAKKEFETKNKAGAYKSDITFDLEPIRQGRKIVRLHFIIKNQLYQEELPLEIEETHVSPLVERLRHYGISERDAQAFLDEQGESAVSDCLELYEKRLEQGKVQDKSGAYLASLLRKGAGAKSTFEREQEAKDRQKAESAKRKVQEKETLEGLKAEFSALQKEKAETIQAGLSEDEREQLLADFEDSGTLSGRFEREQYRKGRLKSPAVQASFRRFLRERYFSEEDRDFVLWAKGKGYALDPIPGNEGEYRFTDSVTA